MVQFVSSGALTAHNWQKRVQKVVAKRQDDGGSKVGSKIQVCKSLVKLKFTFFVIMLDLDNYVKIWYFANNCLSLNLKISLHICDTYNVCFYCTPHSIFLIDFQLNTFFFQNLAFT